MKMKIGKMKTLRDKFKDRRRKSGMHWYISSNLHYRRFNMLYVLQPIQAINTNS